MSGICVTIASILGRLRCKVSGAWWIASFTGTASVQAQESVAQGVVVVQQARLTIARRTVCMANATCESLKDLSPESGMVVKRKLRTQATSTVGDEDVAAANRDWPYLAGAARSGGAVARLGVRIPVGCAE